MKKSLVILGAAVALGGMAPQAHAFDWFGGRLSIGGGYGRVKPKLPYGYQDNYQDGEAWSGHLQYFVNNDVSVLASYADLSPTHAGVKAINIASGPSWDRCVTTFSTIFLLRLI